MRKAASLCVGIALVAGVQTAAAAKDLCDAIRSFERVRLAVDANGRGRPRSVELFWAGPWGIENIGYDCNHHGDAAAKELCGVLIEHMPQEFRTNLIFSILRCYNYQLPNFAAYHWFDWRAQIDLVDAEDHTLRLDLRMYVQDGNRDAIRLVSLPSDYNRFDPEETILPALDRPLPKSELSPEQ
jgi:hypothetical protein